jgi:hypothetical protein
MGAGVMMGAGAGAGLARPRVTPVRTARKVVECTIGAVSGLGGMNVPGVELLWVERKARERVTEMVSLCTAKGSRSLLASAPAKGS